MWNCRPWFVRVGLLLIVLGLGACNDDDGNGQLFQALSFTPDNSSPGPSTLSLQRLNIGEGFGPRETILVYAIDLPQLNGISYTIVWDPNIATYLSSSRAEGGTDALTASEESPGRLVVTDPGGNDGYIHSHLFEWHDEGATGVFLQDVTMLDTYGNPLVNVPIYNGTLTASWRRL